MLLSPVKCQGGGKGWEKKHFKVICCLHILEFCFFILLGSLNWLDSSFSLNLFEPSIFISEIPNIWGAQHSQKSFKKMVAQSIKCFCRRGMRNLLYTQFARQVYSYLNKQGCFLLSISLNFGEYLGSCLV